MKLVNFKIIIVSIVVTCLLTGFFDRFVVNNLLTNELSFNITFINQDGIFMIKSGDYQGETKSYGRELIHKNKQTNISYKFPMTYSSKLVFQFGSINGDIEVSDITINGFNIKDNGFVTNSLFDIKGFSFIGIDDKGSILLKGNSASASFQVLGENLGLAIQDHFLVDLLSAFIILVISFFVIKKSKLCLCSFNNMIEILLFISFLSFIIWNNEYVFNATDDEKTQIVRLSKFSLSITNNLWIIFAFLFIAKIVGFIKLYVVRLLLIILLIPFILVYIADYFSYQELNTHLVIYDLNQFLDPSADTSSIIKHFFLNATNWVVVSFFISAFWFLWINLISTNIKNISPKENSKRLVIVEQLLLIFSVGLYFIPYPNVQDKYSHDNLIKSNYISWQASKSFSEDYLRKLNFKYEVFETNSRSDIQHKNVILLVIESLTFSKSEYFSGIDNKMPYLDSLAKDNISFMNYYSNGSNSLTGNYSLITNLPFIFNDRSNVLPNFFYDHTLAKIFNKNGYITRVFSAPKFVYGMDLIYKSSGFSYISDDKDLFYNGKPRYIFNGVSDDVLYDNVFNHIKDESQHFFYMINTVTTHHPYLNPITKENSFDSTIEYAENSLEKFVNNLNSINYFEDGILVIVGDHRAMIPISSKEIEQYGDWIYARMPLVIIDNEYKSRVIQDHLSNNSLGSIIQYLALPKVIMSREQGNPFLGIKEIVIFNQYSRRNDVLVKYGDDFNTILHLSGDDSYLEKTTNNEAFNEQIIGYIAWLRQREND